MTRSQLHKHVWAKHRTPIANYYCDFYPRYSLHFKEPIEFKNFDQYFSTDFVNENEMYLWFSNSDTKIVKEWCEKRILEELKRKKRDYMFSSCELDTMSGKLPRLSFLIELYGSYKGICDSLGVKPMYKSDRCRKMDINPKDATVLIDTREQKPLKFKNSKVMKLAIGDYCLDGDFYNYAYVDRKSEDDFKSTITNSYDRFCREIEKCISLDACLFVVVESSIRRIEQNKTYHKSKLPWVWSKMRSLCQKYPRDIQFIFSGNRSNSERIIPVILAYADQMRNIDIQYYLERKGIV